MDTPDALIRELLKIAKSDVKASETLYRASLYSQSYFYFQQATEKATKALSLYLEFSKPEDIFKVRHDIFKIHKKTFKQTQEQHHQVLNMAQIFPFFETAGLVDSKRIKQQLEDSQKIVSVFDRMKELDLIKIPTRDIKKFLKKIESLQLRITITSAEISKKIGSVFYPIIEKLEKENSNIALYFAELIKVGLKDEEFTGFMREHFQDVLASLSQIIYAHSVLYFSGYLTIQHSSISRYPDTQNPNNSPTHIYMKRLPVVKYQPVFLRHLKKAILVIQKNIELDNK